MIIKICGITSPEMANEAKAAGADLIGFVFAESRREITVEAAKRISREISGVGKVGVFVNLPIVEVETIVKECGLDYIQLHGDEPPRYCELLNYPIIKAVRVRREFDFSKLDEYKAEYVLLDSFVPGQMGGTGVAFDWEETARFCSRIRQPLMVAGGLTPENVAEAIRILKPAGVDVSGGVETNGVKDVEKIRAFIQAARQAERMIEDASKNS